MTKDKTVTMSLELAERLDSPHSSVRNAAIESLRRILAKPDAGITASVAAPVVERQEPVATILCPDPYDERQGAWMSSQDLRKLEALPVGTKLYTSPPAPVAVMTDSELIEIARKSAVDSPQRYAYMPHAADATTWLPHRWVIDAMRACLDKVKEMNQ